MRIECKSAKNLWQRRKLAIACEISPSYIIRCVSVRPVSFIHPTTRVCTPMPVYNLPLGRLFHVSRQNTHTILDKKAVILDRRLRNTKVSHLPIRMVKIGFTRMALLGTIATRDKRHSSIKVVRMNQRLSSLYENYRGRLTGLSNRDANSINAHIKQ
jgi:hypothetical protein